MGFDVVVVQMISDEGFQAEGINNGTGPVEIFYGVENSILANLKLAQASASDSKVWLTESAFADVSGILDEVYKRCHGVVKDRGYDYCNEVSRHKYECYFNEDSIVKRFNVQADINIDAPKSAHEDDNVLINITVTNTGVIPAEFGVELYEGSTRIGACSGTSILKPGEFISTQYIRTMPNHDWHLTAKLLSDPQFNITKNFTITLGEAPYTGDITDNTPHDTIDTGETSPTATTRSSETPTQQSDIFSQISQNQLIYAGLIVFIIILLRRIM